MSEEAVQAEESDVVDPLELFSEQIRVPVYGLAFIGHTQKDFDFCGHTFTLKTLRPSERAAVALAVKPWRETIAEPEVWSNAQVGMALVAVDHQTDFCPPIGPDLGEFAKARLRFVTNAADGWHAPTLAFLYDRLLELEAEALKAVEELRNLSVRNPVPLSPSPDSLIVQDTLGDPTFVDTLL